MPRKLTYEYVKEYIKSENCELLDTEYNSCFDKLNIIFSCGHRDVRNFRRFKLSSKICSKCSKTYHYSYEELKNIFKENGYILITSNYKTCKDVLDFCDEYGYKYTTTSDMFLNNFIKKNGIIGRFMSNNPYSTDNVILFMKLNFPTMFLLDGEKWTKSDAKLSFYDLEGYKYYINFNSMQNQIRIKRQPGKFDVANPYSIENIEKWLLINKKPFSVIKEQEFKGSGSKLYFKCHICNKDEIPFRMVFSDIMYGQGCPICENRQIGKYNNFKYLYPDISEEWDYDLNYPLRPENMAPHTPKKFWWICPDCGNSYFSSLAKRNDINEPRNCPLCKKSHLEMKLKYWLDKYNIKYEPQKRFKECRNIFPLPFDFFLIDHNILCEAQGQQHFFAVDIFGGEKTFESQKIRDQIKRDFCKNNNIKLLEFPYWEIKNIEKILIKELNLQRKEV